MSDIREEWIATLQKYRLSPDRPDNERFWCTRLNTAPQEELRAIQSEKLRVFVGASAVAPSVAWAKLQSLVEGARLASQELW